MPFANSKIAGTLLFVGGTQFIIALIIAETIYPGYNVSHNVISDLGVWGRTSAFVFNPSVMIFGLTVMAGSYFIYREFKSRLVSVLVELAGLGSLGVGIFPENTFLVNGHAVLHLTSALLAFIVGATASMSLFKITKSPFKYLTVIVGAVTFLAVVLFAATRGTGYLGIGEGGMERMIAYPTILGLIAFGGYLLGRND